MRLYLDVEQIKKDREKFLREVFWPVPEEEYRALIQYAFDAFDNIFIAAEHEVGRLLLSDFNFINELIQHIQYRLAVERAEKSGASIVGKNRYLDGSWLTVRYNKADTSHGSLRFRMLIKNSIALFRNGNTQALALGSYSPLMLGYVKKYCLRLHHHYIGLMLRRLNDRQKMIFEPGPLKVVVESFLDDLNKKMNDLLGHETPHVDWDAIANAWVQRLSDLRVIYRQLLRWPWPAEVLVTEVAKPIHKIACFAARDRGARVSGFSHGNDPGILRSRIFGYVEACQTNVFVGITQKSLDNYREKLSLCGITKKLPVILDSAESDHYRNLRADRDDSPMPESIRTVMIMGYPLNPYRYLADCGAFFPMQLDVQLRVARLLRDAGYIVIYKAHPERLAEAHNLFNGIAQKVIEKRFEKTWQQADAFVFTYPSTSTFFYALMTNRPVILLDNIQQSWCQGMRETISRRCAMVKACFDNNSRILFDEQEFLSMVKAPPAFDAASIEEYLIPRGAH